MPDASDQTPRLLHDFFAASVRAHSERIAVDVPPDGRGGHRQTVTYRELDEQSDAIAQSLGALPPDTLVAVMLPRSSYLVYGAQLGILKAGGAFACIDPSFPDSHVQSVLDDAGNPVLLTDAAGAARTAAAGVRAARVIDITDAAALRPDMHATAARDRTTVQPEHLCYVIYTSGTTGKPKGVLIEHRSIVNLVGSDVAEFGLTPDDRVAQGSSAAYDSSIEETWLALAAGATVVVMDDHTARLGPDLVAWLRHERVSVFCPPPTLLRTTGCEDPASELPDLRLLYVGGEALPDDLVERWARGRRLVNGYGPTECTVTVVRGDVRVGETVTIGDPVPGHTAWVLDTDLCEVPRGEPGELCLAGIGLARGYRNRPEVTAEKFPTHPILGRIYRTGDLVTQNPDGSYNYLGRIDGQVKLRGYRVELEAVEAHLARCPGVREAACRVQGIGSAQLLTAHIVPLIPNDPPDFAELSGSLRGVLPMYMVPARYGLISELPRTVGGKLDRKRLPELAGAASQAARGDREPVAPRTETERTVAAAFARAISAVISATGTSGTQVDAVSVLDDFFIDLGGDSLSAVGVVCSLRERPETAAVTTRDLYETRTAAALAARLDGRTATRHPVRRGTCGPVSGAAIHPVKVTVLQMIWLAVQLVVASAAGYTILYELFPLALEHFGVLGTLALEPVAAAIGVVIYTLCMVGLTAGLKWTLIGRYEPGRSPVWSWFYLRHWMVTGAARMIPWGLLSGTVLYGTVLRALGAHVGRGVHIHRGVNLAQGGWDLLTIGDGATLACDSHIGLAELESGQLCIGPVTIGPDATVDIRATISGGAQIGRSGVLAPLSWLPGGQQIPDNECWSGVPAVHTGPAEERALEGDSRELSAVLYSIIQLAMAGASHAAAMLPVLVGLYALATALSISPEVVGQWLSDPEWTATSLALMLVAGMVWVPVSLAARALAVRWFGRVRPGVVHRWSVPYALAAHKTHEVEEAGRWLSGTLYWPVWLRLAGMKIGRDCEISTITGVVPELVEIGRGSFFADGIYLGGPHVRRGMATLGRTVLGSGTFLGNHVVIQAGVTMPPGTFLGVCTVADASLAGRATADSSWFGVPAMELPRREVVSVDRSLTHEPGFWRYTSRVFWESLRFALPVVPLCAGAIWLWLMALGSEDAGWAVWALVMAPAATLAVVVAECLLVVAMKWALLGRARAGQHPLWSCWCSRWDFLYVAWQFYAVRALAALEGTLLLAVYLRAMGVRIGRRVVLGPGFVQVADPDMIIIEDDATVSANYQAHSFEDRVLKLAPVTVQRGATVGESAVVFYGADIGDGAWVSPNSVVMKNEVLGAAETFAGCPVQPVDADADTAATEDPVTGLTPAAPATSGRLAELDLARGVAVIGMIYMHFVPAETVQPGLLGESAAWLAAALEGKAAALFCILAGMTWELQGRNRRGNARPGWQHLIRRSGTLAIVGVAFHALVWPTSILLPFAVMMLLSGLIHRSGVRAVLLAAALCLVLAPAVVRWLGDYSQTDWNADGSHRADSELGWATLRWLVFDGHYPLVPWLAFPLIGMALMAWHRDGSRPLRAWFAPAAAVAILSQAYVWWADASTETLGPLTPYLTSTWLPTSLVFVVLTGSSALAVISGAAWLFGRGVGCEASTPQSGLAGTLALVGRASLSHYLLHLCVVYAPLRALLGHEEWSVQTGLIAFAGYLALAVPLTALWFRRFRQGPAEWAWARASGSAA